jgi:hypothetical protein
LRHRLAAICIVVIGIGATQAQSQDRGRPLRLAQNTQAQALMSCYLNCDTRVGLCQGTCGQSNSPSTTFPTAVPSTFPARPDPGALAQCYLGCSTQQLTCKQACAIH